MVLHRLEVLGGDEHRADTDQVDGPGDQVGAGEGTVADEAQGQ
ncbi:MAG: hypothetical protein ACYC1D_18875 [Acidimicrobiales bacterium]